MSRSNVAFMRRSDTASKPVLSDGSPKNQPENKDLIPPTAANDADTGLVSGSTSRPENEIPIKPEPDFTKFSDAGIFEPFNKALQTSVSEADPLTNTGLPAGVTGLPVDLNGSTGEFTLKPMAESDFVEFWAKDAWKVLSSIAALFGFDLSDIETAPDDLEQGRQAAKRLYRLAEKNPKMLGWMISESTLEGGDWMICAAFFCGKFLAIFTKWKEHKEKKLLRHQVTTGIVGGAANDNA